MLIPLIIGGVVTWYLEKMGNGTELVDHEGKTIKIKDEYFPVELGMARQLGKNYQWSTERTRHVGQWSSKNPLPYINIQGGGENTAVNEFRQAILPRQKERFTELVHKRENIEQYWRFDNWLGGVFPQNATLRRNSSLAYMYE